MRINKTDERKIYFFFCIQLITHNTVSSLYQAKKNKIHEKSKMTTRSTFLFGSRRLLKKGYFFTNLISLKS